MCTRLCAKVSLLDMWSTSGPLLWIPVVGGIGSVCLHIFDRVGLGLHVTISVRPENFRRLRDLVSGVRGPNFRLFSSWRFRVRWLWGDVGLLCCSVPIARSFVIIFPRGGWISWVVGSGWSLLFCSLIPWGIPPSTTFLYGSLLIMWVILVRLFGWIISAGSWLHFLRLLWVTSSPPSDGFPCYGLLSYATMLELGVQIWIPPYSTSCLWRVFPQMEGSFSWYWFCTRVHE